MADKHILHLLTPLKHMSPFDMNMALDAGFDATLPYTNVELGDVGALVQDAMFSRPPKAGVKTGVFFGGKNALAALDMLAAGEKAVVPPFGGLILRRPGGLFYDRRGDGRLCRESASREEQGKFERAQGRGFRRHRSSWIFRLRARRAGRGGCHPRWP